MEGGETGWGGGGCLRDLVRECLLGFVKSVMPSRHACEMWSWQTQLDLDLHLASAFIVFTLGKLLNHSLIPPWALVKLWGGICEVPDSVPSAWHLTGTQQRIPWSFLKLCFCHPIF